MSFNILNLIAEKPILIKGNKSIMTSFPNFFNCLTSLGAISLSYDRRKTRPIVTIDGPAASGKGTISKKLSGDLNFFHLETGIFYRVVAKEFLKEKIQDINKFIKNLDRNIFEIDKNYKKSMFTEEVANQASSLAKLNNIRSFVLTEQLKAILHYPNTFRGVILEGETAVQ